MYADLAQSALNEIFDYLKTKTMQKFLGRFER